ncbi:MAG: hypothetical protein WDZ48_00540 [Pirellulales bacterium]
MKDSRQNPPRTNPFSTRFVRPGAIDYLFPAGQSAEGLVSRLAAMGWRGQVIGPHGSGKSTLLAALAEPLARRGRPVWSVCLRDGARRMPADWIASATAHDARLIVVDGYEQLGAWSRFVVNRSCRRRGWGLLVTAHQDAGFPTLFATSSSRQTAQAVVSKLVGDDNARITPEMVDECFASSGGDVRETLFRLYDRWQAAGG